MHSKHLKILVLAATLFFVVCNLFSQTNVDGIPFIKNYSPRTYGASEANWAIAQDHRGVLYFGNSQCILEYDGKAGKKSR
jgi:hypothetical protein